MKIKLGKFIITTESVMYYAPDGDKNIRIGLKTGKTLIATYDNEIDRNESFKRLHECLDIVCC